MNRNGYLVLEDGTAFPGRCFGADPGQLSEGEVVFNTGMSGYHEIFTDPSYTGQIVMMTYPHIGNYGIDEEWSESGPEGKERNPVKIRGFVVRSVYRGSVPGSRGSIDDYFKANNISAISDIDTRALTLKLREGGSLKGCIIKTDGTDDKAAIEKAVAALKSMPDMQGQNLIGDVGTSERLTINAGQKLKFAVVDCGIKSNIIRELTSRGVTVELFPSTASAEEILSAKTDAVLFSNGPGDPAVLKDQIKLVQGLFDKLPVCGICLGHQLISLALGAETYKMKFGHHGINNPVRDELTGRVFVTSQNHGFAVKPESLPEGTDIWFMNANDKTVEGIINQKRNIACVQFHPEAAPGPEDTSWIFDKYVEMAKA